MVGKYYRGNAGEQGYLQGTVPAWSPIFMRTFISLISLDPCRHSRRDSTLRVGPGYLYEYFTGKAREPQTHRVQMTGSHHICQGLLVPNSTLISHVTVKITVALLDGWGSVSGKAGSWARRACCPHAWDNIDLAQPSGLWPPPKCTDAQRF